LPGNSSDKPWRTRAFDWPIDRLRLNVEVVEPRLLTALEWVVLRVADEFPDAAPTLSEVADELGLDRPEFLHDTLREVVRLRALTPRDPDAPVQDLGDVAFTDVGRELYRRGQIEAEPATHAVVVDIDALTDEDLAPGDRSPRTSNAVLVAPKCRESIGLDRLRSVMRRFHRDILSGDTVVRSGRVREVERVFRSVELTFSLGPDGTLDVDGPALSPAALAVIRDIAPADLGLGDRNTELARSPRTAAVCDFSTWRAQTRETVPEASIEAEVCAQIGRARREVVLHAAWLAFDGVRVALDAAYTRGVHLVIAACNAPRLVSANHGGDLVLEIGATSIRPLPCVLIADAANGLIFDRVDLRWRDEPVRCALVGEIDGPVAVQHRRALVDAVLTHLPDVPPGTFAASSGLLRDWTVVAHFARLYLSPAETHALTLKAAFTRRVSGLEGVEALQHLSHLGRTLAPGLAPAVWDWRPAWDDVLLALLVRDELPEADLHRLLAATPPTVTASDFVETAVDARVSGIGDTQRRALRQIQALAARRWGPGIAITCPAWVRARDRNLAAVEVDLATPALRDLVEDAADLFSLREAVAWALAMLARLPPPDQHGFVAWAAAARVLRSLAGTAWVNHATNVWREWVEASPPDVDAALSVALELLPVDSVVAPLLPRGSSSAQVLALRRRIAVASPTAAAAPYWATALRAALPSLGPGYRVTMHGPTIRAVVDDVADWPQGQVIVADWAAALADAMRHADDLPALVFWFAELAGLAPALAGGLLPRARNAIQPHRQALRDARARSLPLWTRIADAWRILGLRAADLEALATSTLQQPPKKGGRKK
jgi:hypothetical protein